ncbi:MAG: sigma-54 dependent transcriptional regulator [Bacteroidia bacterium]
MQYGAADFIDKPWENEQLVEILQQAVSRDNQAPPSPAPTNKNAGIVGESDSMQTVFTLIEKVGPTLANVLVLGENGTGKELVARALHEASPRRNGPFIQVDLGAIPENLFESELFGHVKGAFTDARSDREGRFEAAHGGTLFLDEIGNLPLPLQAKLLSALQNRQISRVGSNKLIPIDIRLVCATNAPVTEWAQQGTFRQDLLYRINTVEIPLPPLRKRKTDIAPLANHFLDQYASKYGKGTMKLSAAATARLEAHSWPGNVRELQHAIERAVIMADGAILKSEDFHLVQDMMQSPDDQRLSLEEMERKTIEEAIKQHEGNLSAAAKTLGLGRTTLYRKIAKYGL